MTARDTDREARELCSCISHGAECDCGMCLIAERVSARLREMYEREVKVRALVGAFLDDDLKELIMRCGPSRGEDATLIARVARKAAELQAAVEEPTQ